MLNKTTPDDDWLSDIIDKAMDWHGYYDEAKANLPEFTQKFIGDASWAGEAHKEGKAKLIKAAINAKITELLIEARIDEVEKIYKEVQNPEDLHPCHDSHVISIDILYEDLEDRLSQLQASQPINVAEEK